MALKSNNRVKFNYWNNARDSIENREVSIVGVRVVDGVHFLDGFDHGRQGWRSFRMGRMSELELLDIAPLTPNSDFQPMQRDAVEVQVDFAHEHLLEAFDVVERAESATGITATILIAEPQWLAKRVLAAGGGLRVLGPAEIVSKVQIRLQEALNAYSELSDSH